MAYEVIARKWRPQTFDGVVGQGHVTTTLRNALLLDRLAHGYLFVGPRGVGKTSTARILAKAVNCAALTKQGQPCNACDACTAIQDGTALDVVEIDAASNNSVEDMRDLRDRVRFPPAVLHRKVYIIDEVHMLSTAAFNAFLKTLEEPPDHCLFILATTEVHKIPATILSRCQRFDFRRITTRDIAERLRQICDAGPTPVPYEDGLLLDIARAGDGSMRDAESLLDQVIACGEQAVAPDATALVLGSVSFATQRGLIDAVRAGDAPTIMRLIADVAASGKELHQLVRDLSLYARNLVVAGEMGDASLIDMGEEDTAAVLEQARALPPGLALKMLDTFVELEGRFRYTASGRTALELACLKLARWGGTVDAADVLERIAELDAKWSGEGAAPPPAAGDVPHAARRPSRAGAPARGRGKPGGRGTRAQASPAPAGGNPWARFMDAVKQEKLSAYIHARSARLGAVDDSCVQIVLPEEETYNQDFLTAPVVISVLEQAAAQVWGGPRRVQVLLESDGAAATPAVAAEEPPAYEAPPAATQESSAAERQALREREDAVLRDPVVQRVLERFDGRITAIEG